MKNLICLLVVGLIFNTAFANNLPPNILCRAPVLTSTDFNECSGTVILLPPLVLGGNASDFYIQNDAPDAFPIGVTTVTWELTDLAMNSYFCTQNVTILDFESPVLSCPNNLAIPANDGSCNVSSAFLTNAVFAIDNCGNVQISHDAAPELTSGINTINWTATDDFGNISTCQRTVEVKDFQTPIIANCPTDFSIELTENSCSIPVFWEEPILTDNCGIAFSNQSHFSGNVFNLGDTEVTYFAYDAYANYVECQFTITVFDNTPPMFSFCPDNIQVVINSCESGATVFFPTPVVVDPCYFTYWVENNYQPGDIFPTGTTTVIFNANDPANNMTTCTFDIVVKPKLKVLCPEVLEVSIGVGETLANVYWNVPQVDTDCGNCATNSLVNYEFLGHFAGHNYFRYTLPKVLWGFAEQFAEEQGGYLACINSKAENEFITSRMFPLTAAWIGLSDWETEGEFVWTNGEPLTYTNWEGDSIPVFHENRDYVLLYNNGEWYPNYSFEKDRFILEVPCWDYQNGQISTEESGQFGLGQDFITYSASDICGNDCSCDLEIVVTENTVEYCEMEANPTVWIESMTVANFTQNTGNDGGYGDYTNIEITAAPSDCYFALVPGGNDQFDPLYWRIWIDLNMDGDFYDEDELIFEKTGIGTVQEFHSLSNIIPTEPTRMRVALSSNGLPAPCGNFHDGEVEDYLIKFVETPNLVNDSGDMIQLTDNQLIEGGGIYQKNNFELEKHEETSSISTTHFAADLVEFFLYPNPTTTSIFINVEPFATTSGEWTVVNEFGQILQNQKFENLPSAPLEIDTWNLPNGVYFLCFQANGFCSQRRSFVVMN